MMTVAKCAVITSVLMLTAGSAAWAQSSYTPGTGTQGSPNQATQGYSNPATQGYPNQSYSANQGTWNSGAQSGTTYPNTQSYSGQGQSPNLGSWNSGMQGTSTPHGSQSYSQAGYGAGNITTYQQAEQELGKYGYNNIHDLRAMQGWSADAMRNGQRVHVIIGDGGMVATFPGQ